MQPFSKNLAKSIRSLEQRKFRRQEGLFVAEGNKLVTDNLATLQCHQLIATSAWWQAHPEASNLVPNCYEVSPEEMQRVSLMQSPQDVLGTFQLPDYELTGAIINSFEQELIVALDEIQDPGNLGTIIRLCDWFGIRHIVCTSTTADCFAPKVVQATMGAIARVKVYYTDLPAFLCQMRERNISVYGTFLEGTDIYQAELTRNGIIVMGNEGRGISEAVRQYVSQKLFIPPFPVNAVTSESLNVGIATAITVSEFRRR